jgi:hypothetical protein
VTINVRPITHLACRHWNSGFFRQFRLARIECEARANAFRGRGAQSKNWGSSSQWNPVL